MSTGSELKLCQEICRFLPASREHMVWAHLSVSVSEDGHTRICLCPGQREMGCVWVSVGGRMWKNPDSYSWFRVTLRGRISGH
jgi:hypothetical protein